MSLGTAAAKVKSSRINYGWASIAVVFASTGVAIGGAQYAFGVFVKPLAEEFEWSRTQINVALSFAAVGGLISPVVGKTMDRYGARWVVAVSLALISISFLLRPFITELWQLYALHVVQFVGFPGAAALPAARLVGIWFPRTRGRMMGLTATGANFGGLVMPAIAGFFVASAGWGWGYAALGVMTALVMVASGLIIRELPHAKRATSPSEVQETGVPPTVPPLSGATAREALRSRSFYAVAFGMFAGTFAYQAVLAQIVPHLQNEGLSLGKATLYLSLIAVTGMAGKVLFGYLTERILVKHVLALSLVVQSTGILALMTLAHTPFLWVMVIAHGVSHGGMGAVWALLVQDSFGLKHFGVIFGLVNVATIGSSLLGPIMMGVSFDVTGSYNPGFAGVIGIFLLGGVVLQLARPTYRVAARGKAAHENAVR